MRTQSLNQLVDELYDTASDSAGGVPPRFSIALAEWEKIWTSLHGAIFEDENLAMKFDRYCGKKFREADQRRTYVFCMETAFALIVCARSELECRRPKLSAARMFFESGGVKEFYRLPAASNLFSNPPALGLYDWPLELFDRIGVTSLVESLDDLANFYPVEKNTGQSDIYQKLYEELFPKILRHKIGAYFTPDWLCDIVISSAIDEAAQPLNETRILEPSAGTGAFLVGLGNLLNQAVLKGEISAPQAIETLTVKTVALEKNPLNALAAKSNLVRTLLCFIGQETRCKKLNLPVYSADCIPDRMIVDAKVDDREVDDQQDNVEFFIFGEKFCLPASFFKKNFKKGRKNFFKKVKKLRAPHYDDSVFPSRFESLARFLAEKHQVSIGLFDVYKDYIEHSASTEVDRTFDVVIGNPPWVNWGTLADDYRRRIAPLWRELGIYDQKGYGLSFSKEDISSLISYVLAEHFCAPRALIALLLPKALLQSSSNARGFRKFYIKSSNTPLSVIKVEDFSSIDVFGQGSNPTIALYMKKGKATLYPVRLDLAENRAVRGERPRITFARHEGAPVDRADVLSPWAIGEANQLRKMQRLEGRSAYRARAGVFTGGANAIYYQEIIGAHSGLLRTTNITKGSKRVFEKLELDLEPDYLFPFLRGRDLDFWRVMYDSRRAILLPHSPETKMKPVPEDHLRAVAPKTLDYFSRAKKFLASRRGLTAMDKGNEAHGFYCALRVGQYTFAPFKVGWRYIHKEFVCAVIEDSELEYVGVKPTIPQEKLMIIAFDRADEAYFVCGVLSSVQFRDAIHARMTKRQISTHVINHLAIPKYDERNSLHREISTLCRDGHLQVADDSQAALSGYKASINKLIGELFNLTDRAA